MPVLKQRHTQNFTQIPNALLQDQRLSCRDRGLLVWMLSKPQNWQFSKKSIQNEMAQDGERAIQASMNALKNAGYLKITRERKLAGRLNKAIWTVYDTPQLQNAVMDTPQLQNAVMDTPQLQNAKSVGTQGSTADAPQLRSPAMVNAAYIKERDKKEKAVPALGGGEQLSEELGLDPAFKKWMEEGNA